MKTIKFLTLIALFIGITSCTKNDDLPVTGNDTIDFKGSYSREFDAQGSKQRVTYSISQDKITYTLAGAFAQSNYDLIKSYYSSDDKRWIGQRASNDVFYVLFFKNISETEITIYKKKVVSLEAGKTAAIPAADDTENYGWNTYKKGLPISGKMENLHAPQVGGHGKPISGKFIKFDFETGKITDSDTDWDIAFRSTKIIINGGVSSGLTDEAARNGAGAGYLANGTFKDITSIDTSKLVQDTADAFAISGWYNYTGNPDHLILPLPGKVLVFKTRDGKYAKVEILSYYKDAPADPKGGESRYYTFNYVYQQNDGVTTF